VRRFVTGLISEPAVIEEQIKLHAGRERKRLRNPGLQAELLLGQKSKLATMRERYLEQHTEGLITLEDAKQKLTGLDGQAAALERDLDALRESERHLKDLDRLAEEFVRDLPYLLDRMPPIREYDTVGGARTGDNPLGLYTLTPESIRFLPDEELAMRRQAAEDDRAARFRRAYDDLRLRITAHKDRTLELSWVGGESVLESQVLHERSVSQRT
jgi:hypothetical protein